jgi:hypothetical protein
MRIRSNGNVGIGTSSPVSNLQVEAASATSRIKSTGADSLSRLLIQNDARTWTLDVDGAKSDSLSIFDATASLERMRIDSAGNVGIGTSSPGGRLDVVSATQINDAYNPAAFFGTSASGTQGGAIGSRTISANTTQGLYISSGQTLTLNASAGIRFQMGALPATAVSTATEVMRIDSSGNLLVGKTALNSVVVGCSLEPAGTAVFTRSAELVLIANRLTDDGILVSLRQDSTQEGNISVSGTTVSYNGGHLSRWAQTTTAKDESLVKGTVLSNLDEMNIYTDAEGNTVQNEQLNKVKVSDVEGDANVAGVFVNWTHDDAHDVDEINMAMTGDMIIRIAQGVTVARGDLLMSAGDGTAKPQGDDIVRSKTIAKVTSTHVTCTYADGSYCVPCVLMAC